MKHYLYVNSRGKKFKTTATGRAALEKDAGLKKSCTLIGECDVNGRILDEGQAVLGTRTVMSIKEIMEEASASAKIAEVKEEVIEEPVFVEEAVIETPKQELKPKAEKPKKDGKAKVK